MARIIVAEDAEHQPTDAKDAAVTGGNRAAVPAKLASEPAEMDESEAWEACSEGSARAASESDASEVFSEADDEHATAEQHDAKSELKRDGGRFDMTELRRLEATGELSHLRVDVALVEALAGLEEAEAKAFLGIDGPPVAR